MKCPECKETIALTWSRYFRSPLGRMACPSCGVRLVLKHRWFYWPAMALSGILLCFPLSVLAYRLTGSMFVTMTAAATGWMISGLPADKYLEAHFAVLKPLGNKTAPANTAPTEPKSAAETDSEPEEEQA